MDEPINVGFGVIELGKLNMCESYYDKVHPCIGQESVHLHYIVTYSFELNMKTKNIINKLKNLEHIINFCNLNENHELFSNKNKTINGKIKIQSF